jgi:F-type H+-transporting ATPase subunit gamma
MSVARPASLSSDHLSAIRNALKRRNYRADAGLPGSATSLTSSLTTRVLLPNRTVGQQARGMATEKQILQRITATSNIAKITKSMKMVSAAKMRGAENRMNAGRPFTAWLDNVKGSKNRTVETDGVAPVEELEGDNLFVVVSSDRGLCGGINSGIAKTARKQIDGVQDHSQIFVIGDKARAQLRRDLGDNIRGNVTETFQTPPNFTVACAIAEAVVASAPSDSEKVHVLYNKFKSAISYLPSVRSLAVQPDSDAFDLYEMEPDNKDELLADLKEFEIATAIFQGMIENSTSEESSRMAAMENATTNAEDLISKLTLVYNKARQARITTELIEIISGAASLDG